MMAASEDPLQLLTDTSNCSSEGCLNQTTEFPADISADLQNSGSHSPDNQPQAAVTLLATEQSSNTDPAADLVQQLLPGLSPDVILAVAARMLDGSRVTVGRKLGAGAFSTVYQAQLAGSSSKWVVKRLDRVGTDQMQQLSNEIEMLTTAGNHPNLVPFKGWFRDEQGMLCLLLGQCEGGTLAALLKSRSGGSDEGLFPEDMVMCWFVQLLLALHHLHARRILHRDLKPENVLLSKNLRVAKLADFGISKQLEAGVGLAMTCLGTPHYMSPEVITHRPYTFASDMWALGVVLYEMAARKPTFDARGLPQLVVKILRNAYTPLPLACSRPLQQLVGLLLRADPDDRPTTTDLLGMSLVRKHLQLLIGLAQGVHRSPAAAAVAAAGSSSSGSADAGAEGTAAAAAAEAGGGESGSRSATPPCSRGVSVVPAGTAAAPRPGSAEAAAAAGASGRARKVSFSQSGSVEDGEVNLGGGLSLALQDMMLALRRMARAPLHAGSSSSSSPARRSRMAAAAAAPFEGNTSSSGSSGAGAVQQQGARRSRTSPSSDNLKPHALAAAAAAGSRSISRGRGSQADKPAAADSEPTVDAAVPAAAAPGSAAVYAALPVPLAAPNTKRPTVHTWDASAHWDAQQRKQAELRYQAKIIEQRMAREQARQRRKELDPAAVAKAAQQQQELEALQEAQRRKQQQQGSAAAAADSNNSSMSAAVAAAAAAQDEQLQLLLDQLRAGAGSSNSSSSSPSTVPGCMQDDIVQDEDEIEEEEGLGNLESGVYEDDKTQDEDYTQALALAADDTAGDSSSITAAAAADKTQVAAAGKRAWKLVVASLEDEAFAALLPACRDVPAAAAVDTIHESEEAQSKAASNADGHSLMDTSTSIDGSGLPVLIQSPDSPTGSPRSKRSGSSSGAQQQQQQQQQVDPQVAFSELEQQLEAALAGSDAAAAQEVISSIYRMSLSVRNPQAVGVTSDTHHSRSQHPDGTSGTSGDTPGGISGDTSSAAGPAVTQSVNLWGKKVRPKSAAETIRDEKAGAAFDMILNQMFGNIIPEQQQSSSAPNSARSLSRTVTGRRTSAPDETLRRPSTAAADFGDTGLPAARFQQQQLDSPAEASSTPSSRRASRSSSFLAQQQQQQPRLAAIGGLTTVRPVSASSAPLAAAAAAASAGPHRGVAAAGEGRTSAAPGKAVGGPRFGLAVLKPGVPSAGKVLNPSSDESPDGTPRVDDALKLLRGQAGPDKPGSSGSSKATAGNATAARGTSGLVASSSRKQLVLTGAGTAAAKQSAAAGISHALARATVPSSSSSRDKLAQQAPSKGCNLLGSVGGSSSSARPRSAGSSSSGSKSAAAVTAAVRAGNSKKQLLATAPAGSSSSSSSSSSSRAATVGRPGSSSGSTGKPVGSNSSQGTVSSSSSSSNAGRLGSSSGSRGAVGRASSRKTVARD